MSLMSTGVCGQTARAFEKAGDAAMGNKNYGAALEYFRNAMEIKPKRVSLWYKYAEVARQFSSYEIAESYYKRVLNSEKAAEFPLTPFRLGEVKQSLGHYDQAGSYFEQYLNNQGREGAFAERAKRSIEDCRWAAQLVANPDEVKITQLNKRVNTAFSEFAPLLRGDTLYYSSFRFDHPSDQYDPPRKISKVLYSVRGAKGRAIPRKFNEKSQLTAHATFSTDGQRVYYTICNYKGEAEIRCDLYYRQRERRRRWSKPKKLPEPVNLPEYTTTHPHLMVHPVDSSEWLYFVSDRPGGEGQLDIWRVQLKDKDKFSAPENMKALNTSGNEVTPFYYPANNQFYFSSDGRQSMGGYDVYQADYAPGQWGEVMHMGYPLNTSYNDLYFVMTADTTVGYLSSNRLGSFYLDKNNKTCCNDIYRVKLPQPDSPVDAPESKDSLDLLVEIETPLDPEPVDPPQIEVPPTKLEDFLPLALYFDNDEPDKRTRRTSTKKSYEETYFRYYERRETFLEEYTAGLNEDERDAAEQKLEAFFADQVKKGYDYLDLFSNILLKRLEEGEQVEIFVKGFTSPRAKSDYNLRLGQRRVSSIRNHFSNYRGGIFQSYLTEGQLIITERSFGETTAASNINDDLNNQRLSIYSPEASRERRVEIVEIKRN